MFYEKLSSFILSHLAPKMEAGRCFITFVSTCQTAQHYILYYSSFHCFAKSHYNSVTLQTLDKYDWRWILWPAVSMSVWCFICPVNSKSKIIFYCSTT